MFDMHFGSRQNRCDGSTRRDFLRVGGLAALGLSLPQVLWAEQAAKIEGTKKARAQSVILIYLGGGISHHDTFDLKPEAPAEIRGIYNPIDTKVPGLKIGEALPKLAQMMDKVTLVRSGAHNNDHHETATNWVLCGRFGSAFGDFPAMGAVTSHELGFRGTLPPYVAIPRNPSFTWELGKSAFLGGRYESFKTGDPNDANFKVQDVSSSEPLAAARAQRRGALLAAVDGLARRVEGNDQIATYDQFHGRAAAMILSTEARDAFAIEKESSELRDRYGRNTFGQSCLLARRLVERGVRFATINYGGWDHHAKIWDGLKKKLPELDQGLSSLLDDMDSRGLLANTLVLAFGEFGRTPTINKDAGRDHWGPAASMLFAGAGIKRGYVHGKTDKTGAYVTEHPVAPADLAYTVYESLGIDPHRHLYTPDGRPLEILESGQVIREILS